MANTNEADAKRAYRTALLAKSWGCDESKAAKMAEPLAGLTDAEFAAHAGFLAERRARIKQAATVTVQPVPRQTKLHCPMSETPRPAEQLEDDTSGHRARLHADVSSYLADLFGLVDREPRENDDDR
jgi:hypothetical protein